MKIAVVQLEVSGDPLGAEDGLVRSVHWEQRRVQNGNPSPPVSQGMTS